MDYEKKYKEALERAKEIIECSKNSGSKEVRMVLSFFPELAEGEDEKICRKLIAFLKQCKAVYGDGFKQFDLNIDDAIAWLEKKGEQKEDNPPFNDTKYLAGFDTGREVQKIFDEQKPAEWSEEDEKMLSDIIKDLVHPWNEYIPERIEEEIKWLKNKLKSFKDRVQPQPKQEWSEEDEKSLCMCLCALGNPNYCYKNGELERMRNWLKSLRPQPNWKPSEEQITVLHDVAAYIDNSIYPNQKDVLVNLYLQLKKLREEDV